MNTYNIMIQVCNSTPIIWRKIEISDQLSIQQLHEAILVLFHWKQDKDAYFQINNQTIQLNVAQTQYKTSLTLSTYLKGTKSFTYTYGNSDEELWKLSLKATPSNNAFAILQLLDYEQAYPIYGMGGVRLYQNVKKEIESISYASSLQILLKCKTHPVQKEEIAEAFVNITKDLQITHDIQRTQFHHELLHCRTLLQNSATIAPHLILVKTLKHTYPCYIDFLDDGMELMVFYDQSGFARSILNSASEDPDLLFTNALTIDFLYEDSDDTELYLYNKNNLCFVNKAGHLPTSLKEEDILLLTMILKQLNYVLHKQKLPSLSKHKMLVVEERKIMKCPYEINEDVCTIQINKKEEASLSKFPHTNEHLSINFTAVPTMHCEETKNLEIHLVARGNRYVKDEIINVESMPILIEQLYRYVDELVHDRCIPEAMSTNSINLSHILQPFCDTLGIDVQLFTPSPQFKEGLLDILANTLHLTAEELLLMDEFEKNGDSKEIIYKDNLTALKAPTVNNYLS